MPFRMNKLPPAPSKSGVNLNSTSWETWLPHLCSSWKRRQTQKLLPLHLQPPRVSLELARQFGQDESKGTMPPLGIRGDSGELA